jgi:hypothetical protein
MDSFSVRCLFRWAPRDGQRKKHLYEERITLWQAGSADEAIEAAEREALSYAGENSEYLEVFQSYSLVDPVAASGIEVFSLLRENDLEPEAYVDAFFDTGDEHQRHA